MASKNEPVLDARVVASYQFNRPLMNEQIGFLKVPVSPLPRSLCPAITVSSLLPTLLAPSSPFYVSRYTRFFPLLTPSLSSVLFTSPSSSLYHLHACIPFSPSPTTSLIHSPSFHAPAYSSLCLFPLRVLPSFRVPLFHSPSVCLHPLCVLLSSFLQARILRSLQRFPAVIYSYAAPLNYVRNYAYPDRVSTSEMHPGKCISRQRREKRSPRLPDATVRRGIRSLSFFPS